MAKYKNPQAHDLPSKEPIHLWLGCTSRAFLKGSVENLCEILKKWGINYKIIDDNDICCGSVLFVTGQNKAAMDNLKVVEKTLIKKRVKHLVSLCPGCTRTFKEFYLPRNTNPLKNMEHYTETIIRNLNGINIKEAGELIVTYHDPCHLARHMNITEPPREIIKALPKVTFIELPTNGDNAFCCGSGGGMRSYNKELANHASLLRLTEAAAIGAEILLTSCPFCERSFRNAQELPEAPKELKILNLVDFLPRFL
jgi:Fe-S oxidoreductase